MMLLLLYLSFHVSRHLRETCTLHPSMHLNRFPTALYIALSVLTVVFSTYVFFVVLGP